MRHYYLGVDPGKTGALALVRGSNVEVYDLPTIKIKVGNKNTTKYDIPALKRILTNIKHDCRKGSIHVVIESLHAMPINGSIANFSLGTSFGMLETAMVFMGFSVEYVPPQRWKKDIGIAAGSDKHASRLSASKLFPDHSDLFSRVKDDGRADAALMAVWLRRNMKGQ